MRAKWHPDGKTLHFESFILFDCSTETARILCFTATPPRSPDTVVTRSTTTTTVTEELSTTSPQPTQPTMKIASFCEVLLEISSLSSTNRKRLLDCSFRFIKARFVKNQVDLGTLFVKYYLVLLCCILLQKLTASSLNT